MVNDQAADLMLTERLREIAIGPAECPQCGKQRGDDAWGDCKPQFSCGYPRSSLPVDDAVALIEAADLIEEMEFIFELRFGADGRARDRWQAAHPGNDLVWPDHADLVVWLMAQLDGLRIAKEDRDGA